MDRSLILDSTQSPTPSQAAQSRLLMSAQEPGKPSKVRYFAPAKKRPPRPRRTNNSEISSNTVRKPGRNSPCPCGSGKKYKRCHGAVASQERIDSTISRAVQQSRVAQVQRERQQGLGKPIISAEVGEHRLVVVKNRLMASKGWKTFHDFLGDYIRSALGVEWGNAEIAKPEVQRHPVIMWYQKYCQLQRRSFVEPGKIASAPSTGASAAYLHLAYDLYALDHNAELQDKLLRRLRNHGNFQGARYEVFVAAAFVRAGFEIDFEDESDGAHTHCEFTATHMRTHRKVSVEAKRRDGKRFRLGRLFNDALRKHANHDRVIFIDMNMADTATDESKPPYFDSFVRRLRSLEGQSLDGRQRPAAYVFATNAPLTFDLDGPPQRCSVVPEGFQIADFKGAGLAVSPRHAIEARKSHIEMHELMQSIRDHSEVPATFDGQIPEFAFGAVANPIVIGQRYMLAGPDGIERPAVVASADVTESECCAWCVVTFDDGPTAIVTMPLSETELAVWKRHPDTFFGVLGQRKTRADTPIQLYDFFYRSTKESSREQLLAAVAGQRDFEILRDLTQAQLADIWAERLALGALALQPSRNAT